MGAVFLEVIVLPEIGNTPHPVQTPQLSTLSATGSDKTMRHLALIFALMTIALPAPALAADWVQTGVTEADGDIFYVDRQSIRTMPNGYKRAWNRVLHKLPTELGFTTSRLYYEFDCNQGRLRIISSVYFKDDDVAEKHNNVNSWDYASPDSMADGLIKFVCRK